MSSTDGEDPQIFKCNACNYVGPRPDCFKVYCEKYDYTENSQLQQELASLRKQLVKLTNECEHHAKRQYHLENYYNEQLKQQEKVIRELIPIAQWGYDLLVPFDKERMGKEWPATIEKAKALTTKDK